jgi:putative DNA primase/helicase
MLDVLLALFGDYGQASDTTLFTAQTQRGPCEEKARLKGVRLATASELPDGSILAENTMKSLSGGDKIVANFKYGHTFEFEPSHTFLVATNHAPIVRGDDPAIWNRLKLIPFTAYYPDDAQTTDKGLKQKLMAELPGILNWAIAGYKTYEAKGLPAPQAVRAATQKYRADSDVLAAFIGDECVVHKNRRAKASLLYGAYTQWHSKSGEDQKTLLTMRRFTAKLRERGFADHTANGVVFDGIGLLEMDHAERNRNDGMNEGPFQNFPPSPAHEESLGKGGSFVPSFRRPRAVADGGTTTAAAKEEWQAAL